MASNQDTLRLRVYKFYKDNVDKGKLFTVRHFLSEGESKATIYRILKRCSQGLECSRQSGSGRKIKLMTKKRIRKLEFSFNDSGAISVRQAARKFNISKSYVHKIVKKKLNMQYRKKFEFLLDQKFKLTLQKQSVEGFIENSAKNIS